MGRGTSDDAIDDILRRSNERAEQVRAQREQEQRAAADRAERALADLTVIDPGPIAYSDLEVAGDEDLERQIDARWGVSPDQLKFRLVELDPQLLAEHAPPGGLQYYLDLAAEKETAGDPEDEEEWDEDEELFPDGRRRYEIASGYAADFRAGRPVTPIVLDLTGEITVLDGFHRLAGAPEAKAPKIRAYELLPEDE